MKIYGSDALRNVAFVGHGSSGKTTLVDALAFVAGSTKRHGSIKSGTTLTDTSADEVERKHSIDLGLGFAEWMGTKINLLDTPGLLDFYGEVAAALSVADAAVVVLSGTSGVEVGTERVWEHCDRLHLPRILFVSQMDKEHARFERVFNDIKEHLTPKVLPVEVPVGDGAAFTGILNLFTGTCQMFKAGAKDEYDEGPVPPQYQELFARYTDQFTEAVAATDERLIEKYLAGQPLTRDEVVPAMKKAILAGDIVPLFCGSGERLFGVRTLLTEMVELFPSPLEVARPADGPLVGRVFKIVSEPHVGDVSLFRLYAGQVKTGEEVWNHEHSVAEKLSHLSVRQGRERIDVAELFPGDIGAVAKLRDTHTNDTFCRRDHPVHLDPIDFPEAEATAAVVVKVRGEEDKLAAGLHRLHEEDPTFHFEYSSELGQTLIHGLGERHFEILMGRLEKKHGVHAELARPKVAYRETIRATAEGQGKHKKQSGGRGQYGDCWIRLSPRPRGAGYEFANGIVGGVIPGKFVPAVDRGIQEAAARGTLAGYPLVDFRAECYDGSYHDVDSNEMSFKMAGILAFRNVAPKTRPVLLEPVMEVDVFTPDEMMGDVLGDLSPRRAHIVGTEAVGRLAKISALVPQAELYRYSTALHSLTHGRGAHREQVSRVCGGAGRGCRPGGGRKQKQRPPGRRMTAGRTPRGRPLLIAVVGGSGSGKTTVSRGIYDQLGFDAAFVDQDAYYKDLSHLPLEQRVAVNFDHPDAFDTDLLVAHLEALRSGQPIDKPTYDFAAHTRADARVRIDPKDVVIVDGIMLLADGRLRALFDIKIFVDVADDVRFIRRLQRDVTERGRSMDGVIRQYLGTVRPMHLEFVEPSKRYADVILPEGGHNQVGVDMVLARVFMELSQRR